MPYKSNKELPKSVRNALPPTAQTLYRKVFNSADKQYDSEKIVHQTAWAAVKKSYKKSNGKWVKK